MHEIRLFTRQDALDAFQMQLRTFTIAFAHLRIGARGHLGRHGLQLAPGGHGQALRFGSARVASGGPQRHARWYEQARRFGRIASERGGALQARKLANGAEATLEWSNDKPTVLALREVAAGHVGLEILEEPDRPAQDFIPEPEFMGELRAPHLGLGD